MKHRQIGGGRWQRIAQSVIARFRTTASSTATSARTDEQTEILIDNVIGSQVLAGNERDTLERDRELLRAVIRGEITADEAIDKIMAELVAEGIVLADWNERGKRANDSLAPDS